MDLEYFLFPRLFQNGALHGEILLLPSLVCEHGFFWINVSSESLGTLGRYLEPWEMKVVNHRRWMLDTLDRNVKRDNNIATETTSTENIEGKSSKLNKKCTK